MPHLFRSRTLSLSMVVLVLVAIVVLQTSISYTIAFGRLDRFVPAP